MKLHPCTRKSVKSVDEVRCWGGEVTVQLKKKRFVCGWVGQWVEGSHAGLVYLTRSFPVPSQRHSLQMRQSGYRAPPIISPSPLNATGLQGQGPVGGGEVWRLIVICLFSGQVQGVWQQHSCRLFKQEAALQTCARTHIHIHLCQCTTAFVASLFCWTK